MPLKNHILLIVFGLLLSSCGRIKKKGSEVVGEAKEKIREKKDAVIDKVIPAFDSHIPDTKFNKKRFKEFFGFDPTTDVSNIYCFADQMGIDSKFMFSFNCAPSTKNRIVQRLLLTKTEKPDNFGGGLWRDFPWWESEKIITLNPYIMKGEHGYFRYLWYDSSNRKAYYFDFDL